ncbi:hypothetical protein H310_00168 [Aphanomyces invadans]|uniref:Uncharacterized protein n=1 Tax=Aphanomyces invadans TaxID=157072 RepID=A0A024UVE6_9STRA|nr:hypothetical protein H310_00168 [Aphanomyces invadans]ETW09638.1 hypothetical protein H310_00168 [Aphanomyces invadans]|eukprot:XP_008861049.1 hypothetical protein H310_00168 [Aphanomyces invadans]
MAMPAPLRDAPSTAVYRYGLGDVCTKVCARSERTVHNSRLSPPQRTTTRGGHSMRQGFNDEMNASSQLEVRGDSSWDAYRRGAMSTLRQWSCPWSSACRLWKVSRPF